MSNHVELTDDERKDVAAFWGDYFRSSGEGRQPTAFQLDAINDKDVRDAFLFWHISADPEGFKTDTLRDAQMSAVLETFGANPTGEQVHAALKHLIQNNTSQGVEPEDIDTTTVWIVAHIMWLLLGGAWREATHEVSAMAEVVVNYQGLAPENKFPHADPLSAFGLACAGYSMHASAGGDEHAVSLVHQLYGFDENHVNARWAWDLYAPFRTERHSNAA